jgi:hypothetical protein
MAGEVFIRYECCTSSGSGVSMELGRMELCERGFESLSVGGLQAQSCSIVCGEVVSLPPPRPVCDHIHSLATGKEATPDLPSDRSGMARPARPRSPSSADHRALLRCVDVFFWRVAGGHPLIGGFAQFRRLFLSLGAQSAFDSTNQSQSRLHSEVTCGRETQLRS